MSIPMTPRAENPISACLLTPQISSWPCFPSKLSFPLGASGELHVAHTPSHSPEGRESSHAHQRRRTDGSRMIVCVGLALSSVNGTEQPEHPNSLSLQCMPLSHRPGRTFWSSLHLGLGAVMADDFCSAAQFSHSALFMLTPSCVGLEV